MRYLFIILLYLISSQIYAQIHFDFEDYNIGAWTQSTVGRWDTSSIAPIHGSYSLKHIFNNTVSGHDQISYPLQDLSLTADTVSWQFRVKHGYGPSSSNNWAFFLMSDKPASEMYPSGTANGYAVGVNYSGSDDLLKLWKITNGAASVLINSEMDWDSLAGTSGSPYIRISRSPLGNWDMWVSLNDTDYSFIGDTLNIDFLKPYYFGIYYEYSMAQDMKLWVDDIFIDGTFIVDTFAPEIDSASIVSAKEIYLSFSEPVDSSTLLKSSFSITSFGSPDSIIVLNDEDILLHFAENLPSGSPFQLKISNISDKKGNKLINKSIELQYYIPKLYDVLVTEIMADPDPQIALPNAEYVEIYNRSAYDINLYKWQFQIGSTIKYFPNTIIKPNEYRILCSKEFSEQMQAFGNTIEMLSEGYAVTNTGQTIVLKDSTNILISFITYSDAWYNDDYKKDGGWSLEMVDTNNPCGGAENWKASTDEAGGTPGKINSVAAKNADLSIPSISLVQVETDSTITLTFSEPLDSVGLFNTQTYMVDQSINHPASILSQSTDMTKVVLIFNKHFATGVIYKMEIRNTITDCVGNNIGDGITETFALPVVPDSLDVVINEVLFNPYPYGAEFVELYNRSDKVIDAGKLVIAVTDSVNGSISSFVQVGEKGEMFFPSTYKAITREIKGTTKFYYVPDMNSLVEQPDMPAFNDYEGNVILMDITEKQIDKFHYTDDMHFALLSSKEGASLERIRFSSPTNIESNWHTAAENVGFATPGYINSQASDEALVDNTFTISPEVFSPNSDGSDDYLSISINIPEAGYTANINIYDPNGRLVKRLVKNELLGTQNTFNWDGTNENRAMCIPGMYVVYMKIFNTNGKVKESKKVCVLNL
jgi:hypothetical protein